MPCYTEPDPEGDYHRMQENFRHNSDIAEMLCTTLARYKKIRPNFSFCALMMDNPEIAKWWEEHKERDRKKAESEKQEKDRQIRINEQALSNAQRNLRKLRGK